MTEDQQLRIDEITTRCSITDPSQAAWPSRQHCYDDILWLIQLVEMKDTQIEMLIAPEHVRSLIRRFGELTQTRKSLILELMREMKDIGNEATHN